VVVVGVVVVVAVVGSVVAGGVVCGVAVAVVVLNKIKRIVGYTMLLLLLWLLS